jgi:hypothetical protein
VSDHSQAASRLAQSGLTESQIIRGAFIAKMLFFDSDTDDIPLRDVIREKNGGICD